MRSATVLSVAHSKDHCNRRIRGVAVVDPVTSFGQAADSPNPRKSFCLDNGRNITPATAIAVDLQGNSYVTGGKRLNDEVTGTSHGSTIVTIKYDEDGNEVWKRSYQGSFGCLDRGRAIAIDPAGNVYVTGTVWLRGNDLSNGPKWGPDDMVDVIVRVRDSAGAESLLRAPKQLIIGTR